MSNGQATLGVVAGILSFVCFVPYITTILQGKTRPNRVSWWIWATNGLILSASYYLAGAGNTIWLIVFPVIAQLIIAILSFKYGEGGWNRFDRTCLFGAGTGLLLWWQFKSPLIAILFTIAIDFLGALPTIRKSYHEPQKEDLLTWTLYMIASLLNLFAIEHWSFAILAPPLYVFFINTTIVVLLLRSKVKMLLTSYKRRKRRRLSKIKSL
jgi:hypothetical protein